MKCRGLNAPRTHLPHTTTIRWDGLPGESLCGSMPPEMQPPASTLDQEVITIPTFVLVEGRKRRDSNPRYLSVRSLSRSSTH